MSQFHPRSSWTTTPRPRGKLVALDAGQLVGVAVHWTGSKTALGSNPTVEQTAALLRGELKFHTDPEPAGRGWSDIAYQAAISQAGHVFDCRGIDVRSAANGDQARNSHYGAVTLLLGQGDQPTAELVQAFGDWYRGVWLAMWPHATRIVGHRDLYSTDCPGDDLYALIKAGTLAGPPPGKDPDPMAGFTLDQLKSEIADAVADETTGANAKYQPHDPTPADPKRTIGPAAALGEILASCRRTEVVNARLEGKLDRLLAATSK